ncbi:MULTISPECIES: RNA polymerase sigma factor [Actinomadura]|uniref:RNA polymerase sigma factor n=1 Tax=Actinomadura TaxID=1988 RepID=UPI0004082116|nr:MULTISPECIES: RNA polymerase sigma factor [Actinomadura]RSN68485.1 RNA polymerase sigma factor [Actinomadura sp. WAC 06369]
MDDPRTAGRKARFEAVYTALYEPILGYVLRRCTSPDDAADVVAEIFTVAWRRLDDVPEGDAARLWLYGVARRVLARHWEKEARRRKRTAPLHPELRDELAAAADEFVDTSAVAQAFAGLSESDRELLRLVAWEGLGHAEVAAVLGCSAGTARVRLHRARKRLSRRLHSAGFDTAPLTANGGR